MIDNLLADVFGAMDAYCDGDEENLQVRITGMGQTAEGLLLRLAITYKDASVSRWQMLAKGVRHGNVRVQTQGLPELDTEHDLLVPYGPWATLTVQNAPEDRLTLTGILLEAHVATVGTWIHPWTFVDLDCMALDCDTKGTDLLAEGPLSLLEVYADAAGAVGVKTTIEAEAEETEPAPDLKVFTLGTSWLVAENFVCKQIVPICNDCAADLAEGESTEDHTHAPGHLKLLPPLDEVTVPESPTWPPSDQGA